MILITPSATGLTLAQTQGNSIVPTPVGTTYSVAGTITFNAPVLGSFVNNNATWPGFFRNCVSDASLFLNNGVINFRGFEVAATYNGSSVQSGAAQIHWGSACVIVPWVQLVNASMTSQIPVPTPSDTMDIPLPDRQLLAIRMGGKKYTGFANVTDSDYTIIRRGETRAWLALPFTMTENEIGFGDHATWKDEFGVDTTDFVVRSIPTDRAIWSWLRPTTIPGTITNRFHTDIKVLVNWINNRNGFNLRFQVRSC
jgi:hypothetical protein